MGSSDHISNQLLLCLNELRYSCVKFQCALIERFLLNNINHQRQDISVIQEALKTAAPGNVLMAIESAWAITKSEFLEHLTKDDITMIEQKINAKSSEPNKLSHFSEKDIREVLQDLLVSKFEALITIDENDLLKQYDVLCKIRTQLDSCLKNTEEQIQILNQLNDLDKLIKASTNLFTSGSKISFFSKTALPYELNEIIRKVDEAVKLLEEQTQSLSVNQRAS